MSSARLAGVLLHPSGARRVPASPLARRLLLEAGIPLVGLTGTGPGGRVVRRDVEALEVRSPRAV